MTYSRSVDHRGFYRDFGRVQWFSAIAVILRHGRENQRRPRGLLCVISAFEWSLMYTREESRAVAEKPQCCCKIQYVSKFTAASRGSPYDSTALGLSRPT